jgi:DNA-binding transcriptional MerR regulator/methylmalonyl-CoA mutase cobalamin-binding subunit
MQVTGSGKTGDGELLNLAEVLSISGISKLVLHAWERRYGLEPAQRNETGRRFYTPEQAERFRLLKICSDAGHRIGTIVDFPLEDLRRLETSLVARRRNAPLIAALVSMKGEDFRDMLRTRADAEGPDGFLDATVLPLLRDIGSLWAEGNLSIAAEHLASTKVRRVLETMIDESPTPRAGAPRMLTATLSGEEHEIGALATTLVARLHGWDSLHIGANLPPEEVETAALARGVCCVCLSAVNGRPSRLEADLRQLRATLAEDIMLVVGGSAYAALPAIDGVLFLPHLDALRALLSQKGKLRPARRP